VTLPEKIEEVLRLEAELGDTHWFSNGYSAVQSKERGEEYRKVADRWNEAGRLDDELREALYQSEPTVCRVPANYGDTATGRHATAMQFIAAARNIFRPLAQAYTAALTALEASDSDRRKLAARVAELEAAHDARSC
jgi:hypothetical protein